MQKIERSDRNILYPAYFFTFPIRIYVFPMIFEVSITCLRKILELQVGTDKNQVLSLQISIDENDTFHRLHKF
jgi:hypothetical protein